MVTKTKIILFCIVLCGYGIIANNQCLAMQRPYRTQAQEAALRKRYWQDQFHAHKLLKDQENDRQWLQKYRNTIIEYNFATAAEIDALIGVNSASLTADDVIPASTQPAQPVEQNAGPATPQPAQSQSEIQKDSARVQEPKADQDAQQQPKARRQSPIAAEASSTAQNASDSSDANSDSSSQMQSQMQEVNAARAAHYTKNLIDSFNQAKERGDLAWLKEHREQWINMNQSFQEETDELIQALELSNELAPQPINVQNNQGPQEVNSQEQRDLDRRYRNIQIQEMKHAHTEQEAAEALVRLYKLLADTRSENYRQHYAMLDKLLLQPTLTELNAELSGLAEIPEIKALIENEIKMLQGHMLYRLWEHPSEITPDIAFEAFCDAFQRNDHNAMINLYKTYLVTTDYNESVIEFIMDKFHEVISHNDATAIFDLYQHFLKESSGKEQALAILYNYIKEGKAPAEIWGIIALCFVSTPYADDILPMVAKQLHCDVAIFTDELVNRYDEYRTAIINGEVEKVIELGHHFVDGHIMDQNTLDVVIASILSHQEPHTAMDDAVEHAAMIDDEDLSPEDAAAIQAALNE